MFDKYIFDIFKQWRASIGINFDESVNKNYRFDLMIVDKQRLKSCTLY